MLETVYARKNNVVSREIAGEELMIPVRGSLADMQKLFVREGAASFSWSLLDGEHTLNDVLAKIIEEYDVAPEVAESDLLAYIEELKDAGLVVVKE